MAFIDFASAAAGAAAFTNAKARPVVRVEEVAELTELTALEWQIVAMARGDRLSSLREPGRMSRILGMMFGRRPNARLADPRLETFRRLAVFGWHQGFALPVSATRAALEAGYSAAQIELVLSHIGLARMRTSGASPRVQMSAIHPTG